MIEAIRKKKSQEEFDYPESAPGDRNRGGITMPSWPGKGESYDVEGIWNLPFSQGYEELIVLCVTQKIFQNENLNPKMNRFALSFLIDSIPLSWFIPTIKISKLNNYRFPTVFLLIRLIHVFCENSGLKEL
jgi:hypothetical protein